MNFSPYKTLRETVFDHIVQEIVGSDVPLALLMADQDRMPI